MEQHALKKRISVAAGREPADIVIRNGKIIDVFNGEITSGDIAISDGVFVGIGRYEGHSVIDAAGRYVSPAFIDGHVHIESAMVTPAVFADVLLPHGVTTVVADPHEIGNVAGVEGIRYMLDSSEHLPFEIFLMLPSCVPATPFESAGAVLTANDLEPLLNHPRVLGLGEVMDYPSVINMQDSMLEKLVAAMRCKGAKIDGHAAGLDDQGINVYMTAGIRSDHECITAEEAKERLQRGMYLMVREGSVAKDLKALLPVITERNSRRCLFVTDDKHLDDLVEEGSIDHNIRLAIQQGLPPVTAIQMATLNAAECFGLSDRGAIAPGYQADFLLLNDLNKVEIFQVYKKGRLAAENGRVVNRGTEPSGTDPVKRATHLFSPAVLQSVKLPRLTLDDFKLPLRGTRAHIIGIIPNSLVTRHLVEEVDTHQGLFCPSPARDQVKLAVIERHNASGNIGIGIVQGFGFKTGAIASTVAHDSHNLIIAGTNDSDMLLAAEEIHRLQGGLTVVDRGIVLASLPLPIAGLISDRDSATILAQLEQLNEALQQIGASSGFNPFLTLSFLALPVIPELKLTDLGLFDVTSFRHIEVSADDY